jgi:hypothetical protein
MTNLKTSIFYAALVFVLAASNAQATPWTITASGIISGPYPDNAGLFGGGLLLGLSYTQTITTDHSLNCTGFQTTSDSTTYGGPVIAGCAAAPYTLTTTVNGVSYTQTESDPFLNESTLGDALSINDVSTTLEDSALQWVESNGCIVAVGQCTYAYILAYSLNTPFIPSLDFSQSLTVSSGLDSGSNSYFSYRDSSGKYTSFYGTISSLSINAATLPEPSTFALLSVGLLAGLGLVRKHFLY